MNEDPLTVTFEADYSIYNQNSMVDLGQVVLTGIGGELDSDGLDRFQELWNSSGTAFIDSNPTNAPIIWGTPGQQPEKIKKGKFLGNIER